MFSKIVNYILFIENKTTYLNESMSIYTEKYCKHHGITIFVQKDVNSKCYCRACSIENTTKRRKKIKRELVMSKGGKCEICGYDRCIEALEFHHIDPTKKDISVSDSIANSVKIDILKDEINKCILICSNCHKELHAKIEQEKIEKMQNIYKMKINDTEIKYKKASNKKINLDIEEIKRLINRGLKQPEIALCCNCSVATIKRFISEHDIKMQGKKHKPSLEEYQEYMSAHTIEDFLNKFGITKKTFYKWQKEILKNNK